MSGFNPCCCWNLKDGCVTVGIWSLVFGLGQLGLFAWQSNTLSSCKSNLLAAVNKQCQDYCPCINNYESKAQSLLEGARLQIYCVAQLGIFGWQTAAIKFYRDRAANTLLPAYAGTYDTYDQRFPGYYERYYQSTEEQFFTALFVVQILNLISAFFLLFASVGLIYGVHTNSRHLVWPWLPCMGGCVLFSLGYCITWWAGEVESYWLALTIIEIVTVIVNVYCMMAVIIQYRRIAAGIAEAKEPYYSAKGTRVYFDNGDYNVKPVPDTQYIPEGQLNRAYSPEQDYRQRPIELNAYGQEPYQTQTLPLQAPPIQHKYPLQEEVEVEHELVHPIKPATSAANVQQWVEGVMLIPDAEPANVTMEEPPPSPKKEKEERRYRDRDADSKHKRGKHRSSSARSRKSSRSRDRSPDYDSDDERSRRHRHRSGGSYSRSRSRGDKDYKLSDSDTGYSRSETSKRHRRHKEDRHRDDKSEKSHRSHRHKRNMRDVKREDADRDRDRPSTASTQPPPLPPKSPNMSSGSNGHGGITIPQHIVIPPTAKGKSGQPQRFHINSEITISYSDRSTPNPSDSDRPGVPPRPSRPTIEPLTSPAEDNDDENPNLSRGSNHGSTAV